MTPASDTRPAAVPTTRVGRFTFDTLAQVWTWDDEVFRLHGLPADTPTVTTDQLLARKHPDDRARIAAVLTLAMTDGRPFSTTFRLLGGDGVERRVLLVCDGGVRGVDDTITSIAGYYVDLTEEFRQEGQQQARRAVEESAKNRATIEQAVGGLMVAYGLDAEQAFEMLRWWSQDKNVRVRDLAARLVAAASAGASTDVAIRTTFDDLLHDLTAAEQGPPGAA